MIDIDKTDEHFRLLYDVKGRFVLHRITKAEAAVRQLHQELFSDGAGVALLAPLPAVAVAPRETCYTGVLTPRTSFVYSTSSAA